MLDRRSFLQGISVLAVGAMMPAPIRALVRSVPVPSYGTAYVSATHWGRIGYIGEYRTWNRALSTDEIQQVSEYLTGKYGR